MPLAANALTTVETVRQELDDEDTVDTVFERLINVASSAIESYCRRVFCKAEVEEKVRPSGGQKLLLRDRLPIVELSEIDFDGSPVDLDDVEIENAGAGIIRREAGWPGNDLVVAGSIAGDVAVGTGRKSITVTYTGGYVLPYQEGTEVDDE